MELRREHPGWGPRTIGHQLDPRGGGAVAGVVVDLSVFGAAPVDHAGGSQAEAVGLCAVGAVGAMELWQMDIVGGVRLAGWPEAKIVSGIDDHSRFCVSARVVARATARPTCDALAMAMRTYGVPDQILTDNGKVFTGRFGPGTGEVLFDRICRENGIKHISDQAAVADDDGQGRAVAQDDAPSSSSTARCSTRSSDAQAQLDVWVEHYNYDRPHQALGWSLRGNGSGSPSSASRPHRR